MTRTFIKVLAVLLAIPALGMSKAGPQESSVEMVRTTRGWLGIHMQDLDSNLANHFGLGSDARGVLVADVKPQGPAKAAGVQPGDVIQTADGQAVTGKAELRHLVASADGREMVLGIWRDSKKLEITVKVGSKPLPGGVAIADSGKRDAGPKLGLKVRALSKAEAVDAGTDSGAVVEAVIKGSPAEAAGIQAGDVVLELEHAKLKGPDDLATLASQLTPGGSALLRILHDGHSAYLTVTLPVEAPEMVSESGTILTPITIEYSTGWVEDKGQVTYVAGFSQDGQRLRSRGALQEAIDPLGDAQASGLIRSSESEEAWGLSLFLLGGASVFGGVGDLVYQAFNPPTTTDPYGNKEDQFPNLVPFFVLLAGGITTGVYGAILMGGPADTNRTKAVERYNQVIGELKNLSLMPMPGSRNVGLAFSQRY
jgi:hypothetical protein